MTRRIMQLGIALGALCAACSGDDKGPDGGQRDQGPAPERGAREGGAPDKRIAPDTGVPPLCLKECLEMSPWGVLLCVNSPPAPGKCVACTEDSHCKTSPGALGPKCDVTTFSCICETDADCKDSYRGNACDKASRTCTCKSAADCRAPFSVCAKTSPETKSCAKPCASDGECAKWGYQVCTPAGACGFCKTNADCESVGPGLICDSIGECVGCKTNVDCAASPRGSVCANGTCGCGASADCKGTFPFGSACLTVEGKQRCGCQAQVDCAGNAQGTMCNSSMFRCNCRTDSDCPSSSFPKCNYASGFGDERRCQKACTQDSECAGFSPTGAKCVNGKCGGCTSDTDCASSMGLNKFCNQQTSLCVPCKVDSDCGALMSKYCDAASGRCLACKTNADCASSPVGPVCDTAAGQCTACKTSADCAGSMEGSVCANGACTCATDADCKGPRPWGNKCMASVTPGTPPGSLRCGCATSADCAQNPNGPWCNAGVCQCKTDSECAKAPYTKCGKTMLGGGDVSHCQQPCTADIDCAGGPPDRLKCVAGKCGGCASDAGCADPLKYCQASLGLCVLCKTDTDCAPPKTGYPYCLPWSGSCVACKSNTDCAAEPVKKKCNLFDGICVGCSSSADCAPSSDGAVCTQNATCGCFADSDCGANLNGRLCASDKSKGNGLQICYCETNADCPTGKTCAVVPPLGIKRCSL